MGGLVMALDGIADGVGLGGVWVKKRCVRIRRDDLARGIRMVSAGCGEEREMGCRDAGDARRFERAGERACGTALGV